MSSSVTLGGSSSAGRVIGPYLDRIIKNAAWRKHSALVASCKSTLDLLESVVDSPIDPASPLAGLSAANADAALRPLILSLDAASPKVAEPALNAAHRLFSLSLLRAEIDDVSASGDTAPVATRLLGSICACGVLGDDTLDLAMLRVLVAAVRSPAVVLRGECLVQILKSCYNVYLGSQNAGNQLCAWAALVQILMIVFTRVEADAMEVELKTVSIMDTPDLADRSLSDSNLVHVAQNFINEAMVGSEIVDLGVKVRESGVGESDDAEGEAVGLSKTREDGFLLFKNLCKFSMKFAAPGENPDDPLLLRGKVLSLELLKIVINNAGSFWLTNERFLGAIKQYLCLSLLKNSALSAMSIFQLLCSIFMALLMKFRSGLKGEIGIFFPMLVLRVLENVLQPSFLQKMTVLNLVERMSQDAQLIIDIFVNYDCDVDAPNLFERIVSGLVKTALGVPAGSTTTLSPAQDGTFRTESVKCLASTIKSMGAWMDQQLRIVDFSPVSSDFDHAIENHNALNGEEGTTVDDDLHTDVNSGLSDTATLEQRLAYKIEFQKGISLFNRKPSKGIEFLIDTKKIGGSPEEVTSFLKTTIGLNATMIGDFLGERDEFPLKVMHAYVDSMNFEGMKFGEAIRFFLSGFRLPGEAQKIDRIMEKFAERYCKCNPDTFASADTAYVLAYSVILLNTDAHNNMVKDKMSKSGFIRNNRGIDDGKDLPEDYLGSLYDQIVKHEIKMNSDTSAPQNKQAISINKLLGLDNILNLVNWKQNDEKALGASDTLIRHIQEQFKAKSGRSESVFYSVADTAILRFMMEVCWAPMLAAFSVTLDQSDGKFDTTQSLLGFRYAVHVTSVMCMHTQRDAFVTSIAKFTYLHCAADMKQKNVDAVKAILSIAIEDGNYLQEAWEHVLTCLSRFEQLLLLGEGAPTDAAFFSVSFPEPDDRFQKSPRAANLKKKGNTLQNPAVIAVVRGGSYDSASVAPNVSGIVSMEQINNFISNLHLLDQIGSFELNHIFAHSQRLNGDAIVAFVHALCKVSMAELQSPRDPRIFSLTKIVEIAHYNMNRIRLIWSRIWNVLSDFFVSVGLSENLSVAFFVMDSLRQLAMKFLEREELANYNFQNEFLKPFVVVMQKSTSSEIRELIVRCISQMVLSRVGNVKSGWKSVFMVFTIAAADERKNIVLLAFGTMEKVVRDYFPYITETETTTFTDCVKCLITFTNSKFNSDASLNAIAFLRFCAVKLAEGGLVCYDKNTECGHANGVAPEENISSCKDDFVYFWIPLLAGLSKLTSDPRPTIQKGALEVLFDILKDHGHLFSSTFWINIFKSAIYPIFSKKRRIYDAQHVSADNSSEQLEEEYSNSETDAVAAGCLVDLFVQFFDDVRSQLVHVVEILSSYIRSPFRQSASTGVTALLRLTEHLGSNFSELEWRDILFALNSAAISSFPVFTQVVDTMSVVEIPDETLTYSDGGEYSDHEPVIDDEEDANMEKASYAIVRLKGHIAVLLSIVEIHRKLFEVHQKVFSAAHISLFLDAFSSIASHSTMVVSETFLLERLERACSLIEIPDPPVVPFENECHQSYLKFLQCLLVNNTPVPEDTSIESLIVSECEKMIQMYLHCAGYTSAKHGTENCLKVHLVLPLVSAKKEELSARTSVAVSAIRAFQTLDSHTFRQNLSRIFPLLVNLIRCEHSSREVQQVLCDIFQSSIGPIVSSL
ncbi:Brefeldin A-inhibited guanine nucleotide-exchange protein 1 [Apostasia shenzhenica]|uniref:Brefeldin A-inhibited guanine nucleotide-exchange protein 1 n=1 Tax=Apostasia shenzhenica TaxID=1088818 RepID=A0A2I0ALX9_9ASPA|nr:Brefeldin A-inhibited guanine nucleotide-exchange protein 1 [Apostasia shenzhenica]